MSYLHFYQVIHQLLRHSFLALSYVLGWSVRRWAPMAFPSLWRSRIILTVLVHWESLFPSFTISDRWRLYFILDWSFRLIANWNAQYKMEVNCFLSYLTIGFYLLAIVPRHDELLISLRGGVCLKVAHIVV